MLLQGHPDIFPDHAHPCTDDSVGLFPNNYWVTCKQQNGSDYITRNIILLIFFSLFVKTKKLLASWKSDQEKNKPLFISKMQNFHRILFFSSMEWHTQWLVKLFYCYYFSVHIYMIRLKFFVSLRHYFGSLALNPDFMTIFVSSKVVFVILCLWLMKDLIKALTKWQFKFSDTICSSKWGLA